jgi:hypothetical protein
MNWTVVAKEFWKTSKPVNLELFQIIIDPPEAPTEGKNSNQSKTGGQNL